MKKVISILVVLSLVFATLVPAVAEQNETETCSGDPVVIVRGMDFTGLYYDVGTENEAPVISIDAGKIVGAVFKAIFAGIVNLSLDATMEVVAEFAGDLLGGLAMDENGDSLHKNIGVKKYPLSVDNYPELLTGTSGEFGMVAACAEEFGADHTYYFTYDWRCDPFVIADEINEVVERACRETGHDKVRLVCASMGGVMTVAYLTEYGYDMVSKVLFMSSTFCGALITSDLLQGKIDFDADAIAGIATYATQDIPVVNGLLKTLDFIGVFSLAEKIGMFVVDNYLELVEDEVLLPVLTYIPTMWALVQEEDFDACLDYIFGDAKEENAEFIARITKTRVMMQGRTQLIQDMIDDGVKVAIVSNYGSPLIPVYESASLTSGDMVLAAHTTSGYATVAPYGKTLGEDYVAEKPEYFSPDRAVDLSTAIFPEYTYMIKNAPHVACDYGTDYSEFFIWLLECDGEFYAGVNPDYPQFMQSGNDQSLKAFE